MSNGTSFSLFSLHLILVESQADNDSTVPPPAQETCDNAAENE